MLCSLKMLLLSGHFLPTPTQPLGVSWPMNLGLFAVQRFPSAMRGPHSTLPCEVPC